MAFKLGMAVNLFMAYLLTLVSYNLDLDAISQWIGREKPTFKPTGIQTEDGGRFMHAI